MKSKAHSKKCMEMGVPEVLIEDQDAEDSGTVLHHAALASREIQKDDCMLQSHNESNKMNNFSVNLGVVYIIL